MKLRNLMYATMIACAFASCSKDDENIPTPGGEDADATLEVKILAPASTKATGATEGATDETISSLNVYVFNAENVLEKAGGLKTGSTDLSEEIILTAGRKSVVVLANQAWTPAEGFNKLEHLYAATKDFADEVDGTLSMNSKTYTVDIAAGKKNHLGFAAPEQVPATDHYSPAADNKPVYLYRNVAKVKMAAVTLKNDNAVKYPDAQLKVEEVFILHGSKQTALVGGAKAWNTTYVAGGATLGGYNAADYTKYTTINGLTANTKKQNYWTADADIAKNTKVDNYVSLKAFEDILIDGYKSVSNIDSFYVYENTASLDADIKTLLVVKAKFIYGDLSFDNVNSRYYSIAVGHDGSVGNLPGLIGAEGRTDKGVVRNLQYNVTLGVTGPGWEGPFGPDVDGDINTKLDVKVEVVKFGEVSQSQDIE